MSIDFKKNYGDVYSTPGNGLYVCRFLDHASVIDLINFVQQVGICELDEEDINDFHCTVIHSEVKPQGNFSPVKGACFAHVVNVEHWAGHDGSGYLVATLESDSLAKSNAIWRRRGCVSNFSVYRPHITLKHPFSKQEYNVTLARQAVAMLARKPLVLRLPFELIFEIKDN